MKATEKAQLTNINKIPKFKIIMNKLTLQETLEEAEKEFILGCAILFIKYFEIDRRCKSYLELAYYIILKYSTTYGDYKPLYFFAVNFGFYPIAKNILDNNLIPNLAINDCLIDYGIEAFNNRGYIETLEQRNLRKSILSDESNEISFIAPTSFGKSSLINEHIQLNKYKNNKIGIIVPTKSLLIQTYRNIKKEISNYKFLIHDEMYQGERNFIAIFTQERALRLLNKNDVFFDVLYIDEAHNLFKASSRSILLTRLLKKNQVKNPEQKIIYLSPFIEDINSLKIESKQVISEKRITYNLKEPEIWEHRLNGDVYKYNRFVNEFYKENSKQEIFSYISSNLSEKNLFYVRSPKKIEQFAKELYSILPEIPNASSELKNLIGEIKEVLHEDFYLVKYLEKGILYLHGRLPDVVKEYLESKYSALKEIKYLIANTVILEGINLPIEKLFILSTHSLHESELTNLIGRVNRLNNIFTKGENNLEKLLPQIYFVNHEIFNQKNSKMENKIKQLRSNVFLDEVKNPLLTSFDWNQSEEKVTTSRKVLANEEFLFANELKDIDFIKKSFIENGLNEIYKMSDDLLEIIYKRTITIKEQDNWINQNLIDKIYYLFIEGLIEFIIDKEVYRLNALEARNYYKMHIENTKRNSLKQNIIEMFKYFKHRIITGIPHFYIGDTYGEISSVYEFNFSAQNVYIDLSKKNDAELINLAIVKLKMEDDFIAYKINKFIITMHDWGIVSDKEYNLFVYGTSDNEKIRLIKMGLTLNLISRLEIDNQLTNIYLDSMNNLKANSTFEVYKNSLNDFVKFEVNRLL